VGSGFFCLRGFDIKGDPAGTGDMENPVQTANTELAGMTPSTCGTQCKATAGCQFFILKKSTTPGGAATCYLKMHALGGLYGNTGMLQEPGWLLQWCCGQAHVSIMPPINQPAQHACDTRFSASDRLTNFIVNSGVLRASQLWAHGSTR